MEENQKAVLTTVSKHYITCPYEDCGATGEEGPGPVTHLLDCDTFFGPWYCKKCHRAVTGTVRKGEVSISKNNQSSKPTLDLLRLDPLPQSLFLIAKGLVWNDKIDPSGKEYYYEQHTCPINYFHDAEVVIFGNDNDPHGLFRYVKSIPHPGKESDLMNMSIEELGKLFMVDVSGPKLLE